MPTYEYACKSCGEHLEVVQSFKDGPLTECPSCNGTLRKVFGTIGIAFKGSGFYKTDSRVASGASKPAETKAASSGSEPVHAGSKAAGGGSTPASASGSSGSSVSGSGSSGSGSGSGSSSASEAKAS